MTLDELIASPDAQIDLAGAALCLAADEYPGLDAAHYMHCLSAHAEAVRRLLPDVTSAGAWPPEVVLEALARHLFQTEGFSGNTSDYYDPRNSYLNEVLDRRIGIPISLSLVYMEVGQRLGLSIEPISFPMHFLVRVKVGQMGIIVDPFNRGAVLDDDELIQQLIPVLGDRQRAEAYLPRALAHVPRREVIARMLRNLKAIYLSRKDWPRALRIVDQLIRVDPAQADEIRDRGHLYVALECAQAAFDDYERYLSLRPDAQDAAQIRTKMAALRKLVSRLN